MSASNLFERLHCLLRERYNCKKGIPIQLEWSSALSPSLFSNTEAYEGVISLMCSSESSDDAVESGTVTLLVTGSFSPVHFASSALDTSNILGNCPSERVRRATRSDSKGIESPFTLT